MKRLNEKQWRDEKELRDAVLLKAVDTEVTESEEERVLNFRISTETPDSYDDVIKADGWDLERFKKNPVVLWAHDHRQPPVGQALDVSVDGTNLVASAKFADAETYAFADTVFRLLQGKYLRATSVGFFPKEWTYDEERNGYNFIEQELFEFSIVPVPANPDALSMALKSGNIDLDPLKEWAEKTLDVWTPEDSVALWIPRAQVEALHKSLSVSSGSVTVSNQFDGTTAVQLEETTGITPPDQILTTTTGEAPDTVKQTQTVPSTPTVVIDPIEFKDKVLTPALETLANDDLKIEVVEEGEVDKLNERIDIQNDEIEALKAQVDQLMAKVHTDEAAKQREIEEEDANDLSAVIDISFEPADVESEVDRAIVDLDIDPEELQTVIRRQLERELMKTTGKLPKEV